MKIRYLTLSSCQSRYLNKTELFGIEYKVGPWCTSLNIQSWSPDKFIRYDFVKLLTDATDFSCPNSWWSWDILSLSFTIVSCSDVRHSLSILRSPSTLEFCTSFSAICCPSFREDSSAVVRSLSHCLYLISHQQNVTGIGNRNRKPKIEQIA